jgi:glucose-6-phosphate isomerase
VVISKSGGTPETRNGMVEAAAAYRSRGLAFGAHAVAITQDGSALSRQALDQGFVERFPMWDWVGGRTSVTSAVGLLPAALQGIDVTALLAGAAAMDEATRRRETRRNPAALLALAWHAVGEGRGARAMVVLPYKDRLLLFSRYLQQLVMESIGKEKDLLGRVVHQGLTVYGNKGSTDQHAFVQQLRDGTPDFFATFVRVLKDREGASLEVEPGATSGDFLDGFLLGTRRALFESGRPSLTLTIQDLTPRSLGMLIALYERAVGFYASLVGINAYHQPGVEAGKKAAASILDLQRKVVAALRERGTAGGTCEELAAAAGAPEEVETAFHLLERLAANPDRGVARRAGGSPFDAVYVAR